MNYQAARKMYDSLCHQWRVCREADRLADIDSRLTHEGAVILETRIELAGAYLDRAIAHVLRAPATARYLRSPRVSP